MESAIPRLWPVPNLRAFLTGVWKVERSVMGESPLALGHLRGTARFEPSGQTMRYEEQGCLSFGRSTVAAVRRLLFDFPAPTRAEVQFPDGQPFHQLDLATGDATVEIERDGTRWRGHYTVLDQRNWCVVWRVTGPCRDFRSVTRYSRLS
ncbi:MAG TPA: DUF6314 family protein [Azospirillaceae bacterium]|nr:DUF6314 family protein [Azospirillaceae bacterium]